MSEIWEYKTVIERATLEGWIEPLFRAHATPCTREQAEALLVGLTTIPPNTRLNWSNRRGYARYRKKTRRYSLSYPSCPGTAFGRLRVGIVLHEAAHIHHHQLEGKLNHSITWRREFRSLVEADWSLFVMENFCEVFARHRGPYMVTMIRPGKKASGVTDRLEGPFKADKAYEAARDLVTDPKDTVASAFVYSLTEGQYVGCNLVRGREYATWKEMKDAHVSDEPLRVELPAEQPTAGANEAALLQPGRRPDGEEPVREVDDPRDSGPAVAPVPKSRPVRVVPPKEPSEPRAKRVAPPAKPQTRLQAAGVGEWPKSLPAQLVKSHFDNGTKASAKEVVDAIGAHLVELGVQFPASLISRLKQAGLLVPAREEGDE